MTKKHYLFCFVSILFFYTCQNQHPNTPSKGQWDLQPTKIWEIHNSEQHPFDRIAEPLVTEDGYLYVRDFKNNINYIFNAEGKFEGKFARHGDGHGEISRYINRFCVDDKAG